jgi:hypothetical protein
MNSEIEIAWTSHGGGKRGISRKVIQTAAGMYDTKGA